MRNQIIETLFQRMAVDPQIYFVTADMGINLVERFQQAYPDRYLNVGIAEQSLISVCAGLCNVGYRPFAYTISNFLVHRCYEQIRNDIALHHYPVTLLGTSAGYDNPPLGPTHHIIDDWGAIQHFPGIDIYCPSSVTFAQSLVERILNQNRAAYVRIPKGEFGEPKTTDNYQLTLGEENKTLLVSYGTCAQNCLEVQKQRPDISVLIFNCLRPLDQVGIAQLMSGYQRVITVEDHFPATGLYGLLCRLWTAHRLSTRLSHLGPIDYNLTVGASTGFYHQIDQTDVAGILSVLDTL